MMEAGTRQSGPHRSVVKAITALMVALAFAAWSAAALANDDKTRNRAERALRAGDYERAEKIYRELLSKDPDDLQARLGLSHTLLKQRHLQDAFDHAARVIMLDPLSPRAHALLGAAILASGDFRLSVEEFRTALSLKDDEAIAIAGLGMVDFYENRLASCLVRLRRAADIDPHEPDYLFDLGQAAARFERYREAADAYERFLMIAPRTDADRRERIRGLIEFLRYLGQQQALYTPAGAERAVVPFVADDNRPIIRVRVNGSKESLRFVLDTGSGMSVLSDQTARKIGMRPVAHGGLARAVGGGGRFEIVYGYLSSIEIGEVRVESVPVYIRHFYDERNPVDGYLGISALGRFVTSVDYGTHKLTLIRQRNPDATLPATTSSGSGKATESLEAPPGIDLPVRTTSAGFLSSEVYLEGVRKPLNFIIDTGASVTVVSEKVAALDEVQTFIQPGHMRVFGAAGVADDVKMLLLPRIVVGTCARERIDAAVLDLEPVNETAGFLQSGILGGNFLSQFRLVFNFQRGMIRLEPLNGVAGPNDSTATGRPRVKAP